MKKLFLLLMLICSVVVKTLSAELTPKPTAPENRFLFIVETSYEMNRSSKAVQDTIRELIESGIQGQMKSGDTLGLWTFNEKLNAEFPMQRWSPEQNKKVAQLAADFLKKQRYEKKSQLHAVLPPLYSVIKSSRAVTVVLISSGSEPMQGMPFDKEINAIYPSYVRELHDAKLAFVTILVGRNGRPVAYSVNSSLGPIQIPQPPIEPEKIVSPVKTNSVLPVTNKVSTLKPTQTKNRTEVAKAIPLTNQQVTATATAISKVEAKPEIKTNEVAPINSTNISASLTTSKIEIPTSSQTNSPESSASKKIEPSKIVSESLVTTTIQSSSTEKPQPEKNTTNTSFPSSTTLSNVAPRIAAAKDSVASAKPYDESIRDRATKETESANSTLPGFRSENSKSNPVVSSKVGHDDPSGFKPQSQSGGVPIGVPISETLPKPKFRLNPNKLTKHNAAPTDPDGFVSAADSNAVKSNFPAPVVAVTQPMFTSQRLLIAGAALLLIAGTLVFWLLRHSRKSQPSLISRSIDRSK